MAWTATASRGPRSTSRSRSNCQDAGRLLVARGANPERGGKGGALLAEVASLHVAVSDPRPSAQQNAALEWVGLLAKPRPFDLDAPIGGDGMPSTRATWAAVQAAGTPPGSSAVWSRVEALSASFPVLVDGGERVDVDYPAPDTGLTRPSETAVSRGVEAVLATLDRGGIQGVAARVQACWLSRALLRWPPSSGDGTWTTAPPWTSLQPTWTRCWRPSSARIGSPTSWTISSRRAWLPSAPSRAQACNRPSTCRRYVGAWPLGYPSSMQSEAKARAPSLAVRWTMPRYDRRCETPKSRRTDDASSVAGTTCLRGTSGRNGQHHTHKAIRSLL